MKYDKDNPRFWIKNPSGSDVPAAIIDDVLAGDVVVTGGVDRNGDAKSVSDQIINLIPQVTS